jgi:peptidoglycan/xylan/chitin deacetylase (PgdA/CDA1 family)
MMERDFGGGDADLRLVPVRRELPLAILAAVALVVLLRLGHAGLYVPAQAIDGSGAVRSGNPSRPLVALMFNVDWGTEYLPSILEVLEAAGARSTFFVTGAWAEKNPGLVKEMHARGHEIGNHGYRHAHVKGMAPRQLEELILKHEELIRGLTGTRPPQLFAPPYGECDATIVQTAAGIGYRTILWTVDTVDWKRPPPDAIVKRAGRAGAGALVLMHPTEPTLQALPAVLAGLKARGLRATTVSEVLGSSKP